jgi:3-hydroxybutyryl-CoA dehydrogenase
MTSNLNTVAVLGAGTMGSGIAQVCALNGYTVELWDISPDQQARGLRSLEVNLQKGVDKGKISGSEMDAALSNCNTVSAIEDCTAQLYIEAIIEDKAPKVSLLNSVLNHNSEALLATNTSSIPVTEIARELPDPSKLAGLHFFNPAHIMKLVEIVSGVETEIKLIETLKEFVRSIGKTAVLAADSPGFIVNRVARHFYVESLKIVEDGVAEVETVDRLIESVGFRMGPFKLMDLIGVDTNYSVTSSMFRSFNYDPKFRPSRIQHMKVMAGHNGRKSGIGFYDYR